ncbi:MAG: hypothetical protein V8R75_06680 [Oscillospiraceae bacterium]
MLGFDLVSGTDLKSLHLFYKYRKNFHMLGGSKFRLRQGFGLRPKYLHGANAPPARGWLGTSQAKSQTTLEDSELLPPAIINPLKLNGFKGFLLS